MGSKTGTGGSGGCGLAGEARPEERLPRAVDGAQPCLSRVRRRPGRRAAARRRRSSAEPLRLAATNCAKRARAVRARRRHRLPGRQLARRAARVRPRPARRRRRPGVGRAAHPLLDGVRLVDRAGADRRPDRSAGRRRGRARSWSATPPASTSSRRWWRRCGVRGRTDGGPRRDPGRRGHLPHRRLHRRVRRPDDRLHACAPYRPPRLAELRAAYGGRAGQPRRLPHRPAARPARRSRPRCTRRAPWSSGTCATARARCRSDWTRTGSTSPSAARTSTSTAGPGSPALPVRPSGAPAAVRLPAARLELARRPVRHDARLRARRRCGTRPGRHAGHPLHARAGGGAGGLGRRRHRCRTRQEPRADRLLPGVRATRTSRRAGSSRVTPAAHAERGSQVAAAVRGRGGGDGAAHRRGVSSATSAGRTCCASASRRCTSGSLTWSGRPGCWARSWPADGPGRRTRWPTPADSCPTRTTSVLRRESDGAKRAEGTQRGWEA